MEKMIVISHRGSNRKAPENSMEAFELSIDEGATRIELDLWLSKDEKVFICHDDNTSRTTSHNLKISENTSELLRTVQLENGEVLPTLEAALSLLPRVELNLELKGENIKLAEVTARQIKSNKHVDKIILSSFNVGLLERLKTVCPEVKRALLWEPRIADKFSINYERIKEGLTRASTHIFHPEARMFNKKMAEFCAIQDLEVYTWASLRDEEILNNFELWKNLLTLGVDGHCTNHPLELACFLRDRSLKN